MSQWQKWGIGQMALKALLFISAILLIGYSFLLHHCHTLAMI